MKLDAELRFAVSDLYASYTACLNGGRFDDWPEFFTDDGWYRIVARENYDRGLPLSVVSLKGKPMMQDRVYGITSTIFHAPYYQRHVVSLPVLSVSDDSTIQASTNYAVFRTKRDMDADIYNIGQYLDEIVSTEGGLKFRKKFCVYDNDIIPNSLIYPV
jgi:salicylate 5-hydroxylase small subunit